MSEVTQILRRIEDGQAAAAEELLPLVYEELRKLAARRMAAEGFDHTLQATALVHEAYVRLVDGAAARDWNSRGHFFAAAAEAMRRILVESARRRQRQKHGGGRVRIDLDADPAGTDGRDELTLAMHEAIGDLAEQNADAAQLVKLRYFAGLTLPEAAASLGVSSRTADRLWSYAKAWLHAELMP
jgi:RNA polymerase sigma factor (TIGR02999 family)